MALTRKTVRAWPAKCWAPIPGIREAELLCQEYLLQSEHVIYRIRPRDDKHPVLLPVGERAQFRIQKDKMLLQVEDLDQKEREYNVVSMTPRESSKSTEAASTK